MNDVVSDDRLAQLVAAHENFHRYPSETSGIGTDTLACLLELQRFRAERQRLLQEG